MTTGGYVVALIIELIAYVALPALLGLAIWRAIKGWR